MFIFIDSEVYLSLKNKRIATILAAIIVATIIVVSGTFYINHLIESKHLPSFTYSGGYANYTWSENFSTYAGYMKNLNSTLEINQGNQSSSSLQISMYRIGYNSFQYSVGPIMNLYLNLSGNFSSVLRPRSMNFTEITSGIGKTSDPHFWDSGSMNPVNPTNMTLSSTSNKMTFFGNSTQTMYFTANFINETTKNSRYNFSINYMDVEFLFPSFLVSNNSIDLSFNTTIYGLSKTVSLQANIVMSYTDLSG